MPARAGRIYATERGVYNTARKTFTGKGKGPPGYRKMPERTASEVPSTTVSSSGQITTSGYSSPKAAKRARRASRAAQRTARRQAQAVALTRQNAFRRRKTATERESRVKRVAAKVSSAPKLQRTKAAPKFTPAPPPASKPRKFGKRKTVGAPTQQALERASKRGTLKVNKRGYLTTPAVRSTLRTIRGVRRKVAKRRSRAPLPGLDREQAQVARTVLRRGEKARATRKEKVAALETGLVESNLRNLSYGDADSQGWRQERTSIYGTGPKGPTNVPASADRFFSEVRTDAGTQSAPTPGLLAQAAQGSAFPERYDERAPEAKQILRAYNKGKLKPGERRKLKAAQAKAAKLGLQSVDGRARTESVPKKVLTRFKAAQQAAKELERADLPYVWGGGHGVQGGFDCSGAVSYVLNKMGALKGSLVSGDMGSALEPGPGAVTVFYNPTHTFMRIGNRYFGTSASNEGGGAGFIEGTPDDLSKYSVGHVPGLGRKVAVALGVPLTGGGSFPGMSLSSSGTTATIESGTTISGKPGFSSKPIRLTPTQKARRTFKRLRQAGIGVGEGKAVAEDISPTLKRLEEKYSVGTNA